MSAWALTGVYMSSYLQQPGSSTEDAESCFRDDRPACVTCPHSPEAKPTPNAFPHCMVLSGSCAHTVVLCGLWPLT
jgi:hypothetical protein